MQSLPKLSINLVQGLDLANYIHIPPPLSSPEKIQYRRADGQNKERREEERKGEKNEY